MADADLAAIHAILAGDTERFVELVDRYQAPALRMAFSFLGNEEDAREVAQDAFLQAYQALGRFRAEARFSTWFFRIVINRCKDALRARSRRPRAVAQVGEASVPREPGDALFVDVVDPAADPARAVTGRDLGRRITEALRQLPDTQRTAFLLHHVQGLSLADIAAIMGCRVGTVKSHLFRALARLRQHLDPWWREER